MFPKKQRISKKSPIFKEKSGFFGVFNRISVMESKNSKIKVSVVISKKVLPRAVDRNKLKRAIYSKMKLIINQDLNKEVAIFIKAPLPKLKKTLYEDIQQTLKKAKLSE